MIFSKGIHYNSDCSCIGVVSRFTECNVHISEHRTFICVYCGQHTNLYSTTIRYSNARAQLVCLCVFVLVWRDFCVYFFLFENRWRNYAVIINSCVWERFLTWEHRTADFVFQTTRLAIVFFVTLEKKTILTVNQSWWVGFTTTF